MSFSFKCMSHYSVGDAFNHVPKLVKNAKKANWPVVILSDNHNLFGVVEFLDACEKNEILPVVGCNYRLKDGKFITLYALNKTGYYNLVKILGKTTNVGPMGETITINDIFGHTEGTLLILGDVNSVVENGPPDEDLKRLIEHYGENAVGLLTYYGNDDEKIRNNMVKSLNLPRTVNTIPCLYPTKEDVICQQVINADKHGQTLVDFKAEPKHYMGLLHINSNKAYVHPSEVYKESANWIIPLIEKYSIKNKPMVPKWSDNAAQEMRQLCRDGWKTRNLTARLKGDEELKKIYTDRILMELEVFENAGLVDYMLIIRDVIRYCRENNSLVGLRGSASGCLVSYLTGISDIDPVIPDTTLPYHPGRSLVFERFFNKARADSFPDIDIDLCPSFRKKVKEYLTEKYGTENVAQYIATFNKYDGRGALGVVFRVLGDIPSDMSVEITKSIWAKDKIQDDLEDLRTTKPGYTTLEYNIDHFPEVKEWYNEYKDLFDIAIRLSDTISSVGKHAAGLVISPTRIKEQFPVFITDTGETVLGLEMKYAEVVGAVKYDLLCVSAYEKINQILNMVNNNLLEPVNVVNDVVTDEEEG